MENLIENISDENILVPLAYWKEQVKLFSSEKDIKNLLSIHGFNQVYALQQESFYNLSMYQNEFERRLNSYSEEQLRQLAQTQQKLIEQGVLIDYTNIPVKKTYSPTGYLSLFLRIFGVK